MDKMLSKAYALTELSEKALAGDKAARKQLDQELGKGLVLTAVKRHWMADDGQPVGTRDPSTLTIKRDANGLPELDPMVDQYSDDKQLSFSQASGAVRMRGNAQKTGHAEFKLNGGVLDPKTGIRQRVEVGISLKPGAKEEELASILLQCKSGWNNGQLVDSPLAHVVQEASKIGLDNALVSGRTPFADVRQIRHKFELKHLPSGTAAELSLDEVHAKTMRKEHELNGAPQERSYYVIETELDHLQINSKNQTSLQSTGKRAALVDDKAQEQWLKDTSAKVQSGDQQLEVLQKPQLHSLDHVKEGSFRKTASYKQFEKMQDALLDALCVGFKPGPARQKSAHFAELLGLIPKEQTETV
jgi:hypothetical protein